MIREFGRGTDFKCFDSRIIDSGGVHVIQAFFTSDVTEEIQIKGRAARQGTNGSYSMVLNADTLEQGPLDIQSCDILTMRNQSKFYTFLDSRRRDSCALDCSHLSDKVSQAKTSHYETVDYKEHLYNGNREKAVKYLKKWNGVLNVSHFPSSSNSSREMFLKRKSDRIEKFQSEEIARRKKAKVNAEKKRWPRICASMVKSIRRTAKTPLMQQKVMPITPPWLKMRSTMICLPLDQMPRQKKLRGNSIEPPVLAIPTSAQ